MKEIVRSLQLSHSYPFIYMLIFLNLNITAIGKPPAPIVEPIQCSKRQGKTVVSFVWTCEKESKDIVDNYSIQVLILHYVLSRLKRKATIRL